MSTRISAIVDANPYIPVVPLDFFEAVTPTVPDEILQAVIHILKEDSKITTQGRVHGFCKDPKDISQNETAAFHHAHTFAKDVMDAGAKYLKQTSCVYMTHNSDFIPCDKRENNSRPDGYWSTTIERQHRKQQPNDWASIILAEEYQSNDTPDACRENYWKILWSGHKILQNDPRRNFTFGITTENTNCRFWFFARSHIMVSKPFQFITNCIPLVRLILSLSFAHVLSQEQPDYEHAWKVHGYDPTIERLEEQRAYRIYVGDKWYITRQILSDLRADRICGRGTRVWEVFEEGKPETSYALKDVWVDRNKDTEAAIWRRLKTKINPDVFSKHFLTLISASGDGDAVTTCSFLGRSSYTPAENQAYFQDKITDTLDLTRPRMNFNIFFRTTPFSDPPMSFLFPKKPPPYFPLKHDRSVWKEVGTTYDDQEDIRVMLRMLKHAVKALHALWEDSKAIHRDISPGNILYDGRYGRLGDLELVKFVDDTGTDHDAKAGTAEFMAVEIDTGHYLFKPVEEFSFATLRVKRERVPEVPQPFWHNPLHDLESIWWLLLWTLFRYYPDALAFDKSVLENQLSSYHSLFSDQHGVRRYMFTFEDEAIAYILTLAPPFLEIGDLAFRLRHFLIGCYQQAEAQRPITSDCDAFNEAHQTVISSIKTMKKLVLERQFHKVVLVKHLLRLPKRKAEDIDTKEVEDDAPPRKKLSPSAT